MIQAQNQENNPLCGINENVIPKEWEVLCLLFLGIISLKKYDSQQKDSPSSNSFLIAKFRLLLLLFASYLNSKYLLWN